LTDDASELGDLLDPERRKLAKVEGVLDAIRQRLGEGTILKGRGLPLEKE
jgi:hypothetical protein